MKNPVNHSTTKLITLSCLLFYIIFSASPIYISKEFKNEVNSTVTEKINELNNKDYEYKNKRFLDGLKIQLQKVNKEIQARNDHEFDWLRLKYFVIGSLLLGFWYHAFLKNNENSANQANSTQYGGLDQIIKHLTSSATSFILALTVLVGITVDMQIRAGRIVIDQLGNWIYLYAEPILLGFSNDEDGRYNIGWEQFLRRSEAYHKDMAYHLSFWPNIYFLSIILYAFYLVVSAQAATVYNGEQEEGKLLWRGFWMLHITILVCAISNHVIPGAFEVTLFPIFTGWSKHPTTGTSIESIGIYLFVWMILTLSSAMVIYLNSKK